jgi:hypothetical protein
MAGSGVLGTAPGANPNTPARLDAGRALQLSVEPQSGAGNAPSVVVRVEASVGNTRMSTTLVLDPDAGLDLAMRLVGCVVRLRKLEIGETRSGR